MNCVVFANLADVAGTQDHQGLKDTEVRFRKRYLDLMINDDVRTPVTLVATDHAALVCASALYGRVERASCVFTCACAT